MTTCILTTALLGSFRLENGQRVRKYIEIKAAQDDSKAFRKLSVSGDNEEAKRKKRKLSGLFMPYFTYRFAKLFRTPVPSHNSPASLSLPLSEINPGLRRRSSRRVHDGSCIDSSSGVAARTRSSATQVCCRPLRRALLPFVEDAEHFDDEDEESTDASRVAS